MRKSQTLVKWFSKYIHESEHRCKVKCDGDVQQYYPGEMYAHCELSINLHWGKDKKILKKLANW